MPEQNELEFNINRVGDGPVFELLLNNIRLDITRVGQLFSIRCSGLITERQVHKLQAMFTHVFAAQPPENSEAAWAMDHHERVKSRGFDEGLSDLADEDPRKPPFDGPYVRGPIV